MSQNGQAKKLENLLENIHISGLEEIVLFNAISIQQYSKVPLSRNDLAEIIQSDVSQYFPSKKQELESSNLTIDSNLKGSAISSLLSSTPGDKNQKKLKFIDYKLQEWMDAGLISSIRAYDYYKATKAVIPPTDKRCKYFFLTPEGYLYYIYHISKPVNPIDIEWITYQSYILSNLKKMHELFFSKKFLSKPFDKFLGGVKSYFKNSSSQLQFFDYFLDINRFYFSLKSKSLSLKEELENLFNDVELRAENFKISESSESEPGTLDSFALINDALKQFGSDNLTPNSSLMFKMMNANVDFIKYSCSDQQKNFARFYLKYYIKHFENLISLFDSMIVPEYEHKQAPIEVKEFKRAKKKKKRVKDKQRAPKPKKVKEVKEAPVEAEAPVEVKAPEKVEPELKPETKAEVKPEAKPEVKEDKAVKSPEKVEVKTQDQEPEVQKVEETQAQEPEVQEPAKAEAQDEDFEPRAPEDIPKAEELSEEELKMLEELDVFGLGTQDPDINGLYSACVENNPESLEGYLRKGVDVNISNSDGITPLMFAASKGFVEVLGLLLLCDCDVNKQDKNGRTALYHAAMYGDEKIVKLLLEKESDIDLPDNSNISPLMVASQYGNIKAAEPILDLGARFDSRSDEGCTAMFYAAVNGHGDLIKLLISHGADISIRNNQELSPLMAGYLAENREMVLDLLQNTLNINTLGADGPTLLVWVCARGDIESAKVLVEMGLNINARPGNGYPALFTSCISGDKEMIKYLISKGADSNVKNNRGFSDLMRVCFEGELDLVKILIDSGADINKKDEEGITPLMYSALSGSLDVVKYLMEQGADINASDNDGASPLLYSALSGNKQIVEHLIGAGAEIKHKDNNGLNALMSATIGGHKEVISFLLQLGVDINEGDNDGFNTPVMLAISFWHGELARYLESKGAKLTQGYKDLLENIHLDKFKISVEDKE